MPSIFTHAIFATALGKAFRKRDAPIQFWLFTRVCSILPDFDVIGFLFGIKYNSPWGHRGFTHSFVFSIIVGALISLFPFRNINVSRKILCCYFTLITLTHAFLDALTSGGLGVGIFLPFNDQRYFLPWRPIKVSPIGLNFFSSKGLPVIFSEFIWVWIPSGIIWIVANMFNRIADKKAMKI
jgi:inner membrane protein